MAEPVGTKVDTNALDNLGTQLDTAATALGNALGDPARFTGIPAEAFGPATNVVQNYHDLAAQFTEHLNDAVASLQNVSSLVHQSAQGFRDTDAANQQQVRLASPQIEPQTQPQAPR